MLISIDLPENVIQEIERVCRSRGATRKRFISQLVINIVNGDENLWTPLQAKIPAVNPQRKNKK